MEINLNTYVKKLGDKILPVRKKKKRSKYKLVTEIFTNQFDLARIEAGKVNLSVKTQIKISLILKCKVKDFFIFNINVTKPISS
jgi:DNA-binding XRE family transcriptional regulator